MHVLAFRHVPLEGIGTIAEALDRHGITCQTIDAGDPCDLVTTNHDGLILMGGPMSANDDLPWIARELAAIRDAAARGIPVLGICLGAQLIARALAARVYRNPEREIGWGEVHWTESAGNDPLFRGFTGCANVFQWHGETFDLPPGATHLSFSEACRNQVFRVGNIYGLQFHLEVTPEMIASWLDQDEACGDQREASAPIDPHAHADSLAQMAATVFGRWCGLLS